MKNTKNMKNKYLWVPVIAAGVLVLDQATKLLVIKYLPLYGTVPVIPGFFELTHVRNPGAAFGILSGAHGSWRTAFFLVVSLAALAVIAMLVRRIADRLSLAAFSLIAGGAAGNLIDRVRFGEVVDFFNVYIWKGVAYLDPWPTFNIADSAITVGVGLLVVEMLVGTSTKSQIANSK